MSERASLRREGINVRIDRDVHAKITEAAAHLTLHRGRKVENAQVVREAVEEYLRKVEEICK
jgi:hypothetical protein